MIACSREELIAVFLIFFVVQRLVEGEFLFFTILFVTGARGWFSPNESMISERPLQGFLLFIRMRRTAPVRVGGKDISNSIAT